MDVILIGSIMVLSTGVILKTKFDLNWQSPQVADASVYLSGESIRLLKLDKDLEISLFDGKMIVEIKKNKLRIKQSDCPRQVCSHVGWISHPGEAIVCVPNKVVIEIGSTGKTAVDAVAF
jgi:hypothetical protein